MFLVKRAYFNKTNIIKGLIVAIVFASPIYLAHYDLNYKLLITILALFSIYLLLTVNRQTLVVTGFFTGILWFYWIGISFQYYDLFYLSPFVILLFGFAYSLLFYFVAIYDKIIFRIFMIFFLSFIHPLGFNWFIPELIFVDSYFPTSKAYFALILASIYMLIRLNKKLKILALIPLFIIYTNKGTYVNNPNLQITMPQLNIQQDQKWLKENLPNILEQNLSLIDQAILEGKDLIILPETVFPIALNTDSFISYNLLEKSKHLDIIAGSIYFDNGQFYNATYHFSKAKMNIAKKVVLVPFGEKIPLPQFMVNFINNTFYNGAKDYEAADSPTDFNIAGIQFRNAICYEATAEEIYQNLGDVKYMIATSNNAWFTPSIQPTLQKLLLKYYSKKYDITIIHSVNGSDNYIIRP